MYMYVVYVHVIQTKIHVHAHTIKHLPEVSIFISACEYKSIQRRKNQHELMYIYMYMYIP